jgi:hypothetical protein
VPDQFGELVVGHRAVEPHRVPEPLVHVVTGDDRRVLRAQLQRQVRVALEGDLLARLVDREDLAGHLVDRQARLERLGLGDLGQPARDRVQIHDVPLIGDPSGR